MASSKKQRCLQSSSTGDELDSSLGYKAVGKFHKEKLPTRAEVIGYVVHLTQTCAEILYGNIGLIAIYTPSA